LAGLNLAEDNGFLMAIKVRSMTSFKGEAKTLGYVVLQHFESPYSMKRDTCRLYSQPFLAKFLTASLLGVSWLLPESSGW
jgi:hypothetical protein